MSLPSGSYGRKAVQLTLHFRELIRPFRYYARSAHYKSCCPHQKKTIRKGCLFSCGSGLETKLRFVGKRHCVCLPLHAVQLAQRFASKLARLCYYARFAHYKSCCPHHLCSTKKPQTRKSTRYSSLVLSCCQYIVLSGQSEIFEFRSCILTCFSKNRT